MRRPKGSTSATTDSQQHCEYGFDPALQPLSLLWLQDVRVEQAVLVPAWQERHDYLPQLAVAHEMICKGSINPPVWLSIWDEA